MNEVNKKAILSAIEEMKKQGVVFESGLTNEEINQIESTSNINFPPDLKFFYQNSLPISASSSGDMVLFPAWRQSVQNKKTILFPILVHGYLQVFALVSKKTTFGWRNGERNLLY